jgi:U3 small nucleolar RNA-associated protein 13
MSDYLKKRKRTENKNSKIFKDKNRANNKSKGFMVKINKTKQRNNETYEQINFDAGVLNGMVSEDTIKIGKFWDGKTLIEPKNTKGKLFLIEKPDKNLTISQVGDGLYILNTDDFSLVDKLYQNEENILTFTYNNKKNEIYCAMENSLVKVFDFNNLSKPKKVWKLNKEIAKFMKIDPSFKFLAVVTSRNNILVYDTENYKLLNSFSGHTGFIYDIQFNPDKEKFLIYSGSEDGTIKVWDIILNKCVASLDGHTRAVRHIQLTNDGKSLISATADNNIYVWKLSNKSNESSLLKFYNFNKEISSINYFTKSRINKEVKELTPSILVGCEDGSLVEFNLKTGKSNEKVAKFTEQPIIQIHYSSQTSKMYLLTSDQMIIHLTIDLVNNDISQAKLIKLYPGYCQELLDVKLIISNETKLEYLFSSNENNLKFYQEDKIEKKIVIKSFEGHDDFIMHIDIKDNYISTSSKDNTIRIWTYEEIDGRFTCKCIAILRGHSEAVNCSALMVKKGGKKVVSASKDLSVKIWDFQTAEEEQNKDHHLLIKQSIFSENAHNEEVNVVKVAPNEKIIASGSYDKTIKIYSEKLKLLSSITGHKRAIIDLSFSKYAKLLASSSTDKTIKIWNLTDYSCINTFEGHLASVLRIQWVYFGTHIISGGADGLVKFWNLKTSECLSTINAHDGKIWALDIDQSESTEKKSLQFLTGGTDSKIMLWTDVTQIKETETLQKEEETILKKEQLRYLNDDKQYYEAMKLALELNHRSEFVGILKNFVNDSLNKNNQDGLDNISIIINNRKVTEEESDNKDIHKDANFYFKENLAKLIKDENLKKIIKSNIQKILEITRDNNLRSSNFLYVQILLKAILISTNYEFFFNKEAELGKKNKKLKKERKAIDYIENFTIIKSYSEKHLERLNREITKSYLVDFVLEKMKII